MGDYNKEFDLDSERKILERKIKEMDLNEDILTGKKDELRFQSTPSQFPRGATSIFDIGTQRGSSTSQTLCQSMSSDPRVLNPSMGSGFNTLHGSPVGAYHGLSLGSGTNSAVLLQGSGSNAREIVLTNPSTSTTSQIQQWKKFGDGGRK